MQAVNIFTQELNEIEAAIAQLQEILKSKKEAKKLIIKQQRLVEKTIGSFKAAVEKLSGSNNASEYLREQVLGLIGFDEVEKKSSEELAPRPTKENRSNELFTWQPTSNEAIANYFNVCSGLPQATYIGSNSKQRLEEIESKLLQWLPGVSCSLRCAQRLPYTYELKIKGLDDDSIGWLTAIDFSKPIIKQLQLDWSDCPSEYLSGQSCELCCNVSIEPEERSPVTEQHIEPTVDPESTCGNMLFPKYALVKSRLSSKHKEYYQVLAKGATKDFLKVWNLETGKLDSLRAKNLQQVELPCQYHFWKEKTTEALENPVWQCEAVYYRWRFGQCQSKKEFEDLKKEDPESLDVLRWAYKHLPEEEKSRIDSICKGQVRKLERKSPIGGVRVGARVEIVADRHDGKYVGKLGTITNADSDIGVAISLDVGETKFFLRSEIKQIQELLAS